jgi:hypothetical protein
MDVFLQVQQHNSRGSVVFSSSDGQVGDTLIRAKMPHTPSLKPDDATREVSTDRKSSSLFESLLGGGRGAGGGGESDDKDQAKSLNWMTTVQQVDATLEANELGRAYKNWVETHFTMHPECVIPVPSTRDPKVCVCGREIGLVTHCPPPGVAAAGGAAACGDPQLTEWKLDANVALAPTTSYGLIVFKDPPPDYDDPEYLGTRLRSHIQEGRPYVAPFSQQPALPCCCRHHRKYLLGTLALALRPCCAC